jgi:hypothetical protein
VLQLRGSSLRLKTIPGGSRARACKPRSARNKVYSVNTRVNRIGRSSGAV